MTVKDASWYVKHIPCTVSNRCPSPGLAGLQINFHGLLVEIPRHRSVDAVQDGKIFECVSLCEFSMLAFRCLLRLRFQFDNEVRHRGIFLPVAAAACKECERCRDETDKSESRLRARSEAATDRSKTQRMNE